MTTTAYLTLADIQAYGGPNFSTSGAEAWLTAAIPMALQALGNYCNRDFASKPYAEYRNGNGKRSLLTVGFPVTSLAGVTVDGQVIPIAAYQATGAWIAPYADFNQRNRRIVLTNFAFNKGLQNVALTYTAGYGDGSGAGGADIAPWPADLQEAGMIWIMTRFNERQRYGVGSKTLASETVTFDAGSGTSAKSQGIPAAAQQILANYVNTVFETGS